MKALIAQHKEDKSEVLLCAPTIAESISKFYNKSSEDKFELSKEDFIKYLETLEENKSLVYWAMRPQPQELTPMKLQLYNDLQYFLQQKMRLSLDNIAEVYAALDEIYYDKDYILRYFDDEDYDIYIS